MTEAYSYEDLYELLRIERASADLEKLDVKDLKKIAAYIKAKEDLLKQQDISTSFSSTKSRVKIQLEIDNALQLLKDLFEKREGKVLNRALFSVRSESKLKDTTNMLEHEEELYNQLLDLLSKNKEVFFNLVEEQKALAIPEAAEPEIKPEPKETTQFEPETHQKALENTTETKLVEFIDDTPEFIDETLTPCGPFKKGDQATLSYTICQILLKQGKAKEVN